MFLRLEFVIHTGVCTVCDGNQANPCPECDGMGFRVKRVLVNGHEVCQMEWCEACKQTGYVTCPRCGGSGSEPDYG